MKKHVGYFALLLGAALLGLGGCSSETGQTTMLQDSVAAVRANRAPRAQPPLTAALVRTRLTPELRAQLGVPLMIAELPKLKLVSTLLQAAVNGPVITWQTPDGIAVSTQGGLLKATRGLDSDLMAADVSAALQIITGSGTGQARRVQRYINGENHQVTMILHCDYRRQGTLVIEACVSDRDEIGQRGEITFKNRYWLTASGQIQRSEQWLGQKNGFMRLEDPIFE